METNAIRSRDDWSSLIEGAKKGDPAAFGTLYEHYFAPIFRFVCFRVKNRRDAEDLTQTVFLKAWDAMPRFEQRDHPFSSWLYAIARNATIDYYKKKKPISLDDAPEIADRFEDAHADFVKRTEREDTARMIRRAMNVLSDDQREIMLFKHIENLSNREISRLTGKNEDAIRQLQFRALRSLQKYFKESYPQKII